MPTSHRPPTSARLAALGLSTLAMTTASAAPALAHGIGQARLPVPLWSVLYGAVIVLIISFAGLGVFWKRPRLEDPEGGMRLPDGVTRVLHLLGVVGRMAGSLLLVVMIVGASRGSDFPSYLVFIGLWVVVPIVAALVGDVYRAINPFEMVARVLERNELGEEREWLDRVGVYPAAVLLLGFGWLELVHPHASDPSVIFGVLVFYTGVMVLGGLQLGPRWIRAADAFGVYFRLVGKLGIVQRDPGGGTRLRAPLVGLAQIRPERGTAAVVLVALGVTSFDGLKGTGFWEGFVLGTKVNWAAVPFDTIGLLVIVGIVIAAYVVSMEAASPLVERGLEDLAEDFAHTLVPIALGYAIAHYVSLVVYDGQTLLALASDPLRLDWDLFGTKGNRIDFSVIAQETVAIVQVLGIVLGHVAGVVLAHDRATARFPADVASRSQHALLAAMILYTVGGLVLLLGA